MAKDEGARAERLAQALRDNLKRRKAQARERVTEAPCEREANALSPPAPPSRD